MSTKRVVPESARRAKELVEDVAFSCGPLPDGWRLEYPDDECAMLHYPALDVWLGLDTVGVFPVHCCVPVDILGYLTRLYEAMAREEGEKT